MSFHLLAPLCARTTSESDAIDAIIRGGGCAALTGPHPFPGRVPHLAAQQHRSEDLEKPTAVLS